MNVKMRSKGFTLIELIITVAIIAILATIAIPSYSRYITRSRASSAASDVYALTLAMENMYQRQLSYTVTTAAQSNADITAYTNNVWAPTEAGSFNYSLNVDSSTTYTITATGITGTNVSGCTLTFQKGVNTPRGVTVTNSDSCGGFNG